MNKKSHFYCRMKSEDCLKSKIGSKGCSMCNIYGDCKYCGRSNTNNCEDCMYKIKKNNNK